MAIEADLVARTMHLSPDDRAELALRLILSLETEPLQQDLDHEWEVEIERRLAAVDRGEVTPLEWRAVIDRARGSLRRNERP